MILGVDGGRAREKACRRPCEVTWESGGVDALFGAQDTGGVMDDARPLAVFDLDGTLADSGHRQHFLEGARRDWTGFFAAAVDDPPLDEGVRLVLSSAEECEIRYLTGRPERCRRDTVAWLEEQGLPEGRVYMRRNDDRRPPATPSWRS